MMLQIFIPLRRKGDKGNEEKASAMSIVDGNEKLRRAVARSSPSLLSSSHLKKTTTSKDTHRFL